MDARRDRKGRRKVKKAKEAQEAPAPQAEISRWGRCLALLLAAAVAQAVVGLAALQSRETVASSDFLVETGTAGPVAVFADPEAPFVVVDGAGSLLDPGDLAVLVVGSGRKAWLMRATLQSLSSVDGLRRSHVLVSLAAPGEVSKEFGFACVAPGGMTCRPAFEEAASREEHLRRSLRVAVDTFGGRGGSLVVLEEGQIFSLDLLWFFVQLVPALHADESLLCATAWNANGLAPYASDVTALFRGDDFSPLAWMMLLEQLNELLSQWQAWRWRDWLTERMRQLRQQCVYPEVSRVALASAECLRPVQGPLGHMATLPVVHEPVTATPSTRCNPDQVEAERISIGSVTSGQLRGFLGDVRRVQAAYYEDWFLWRWPGRQGMFYSKAVSSVAELDVLLSYEPGFLAPMHKAGLPLRIVLQPQAGNASGTWTEAAQYFGLGRDRPRGVYKGVIRLRWRDVLLYLVVDAASPLLSSTEEHQRGWWDAPKVRLSAKAFQRRDPRLPAHRPVPPEAALSAAPLGDSCSRHCESQGHVCVDADLMAVAVCAPPLTLSFGCSVCEMEGSSAAYPGLHRDTGRCTAGMPAPGAPVMAGDCSAFAQRVRRLCVCRRGRLGTLRLGSPGLHFTQERKSVANVASPERLEAFRSAMLRARRPANLSTFMPQQLPMFTEHIFVVVLASGKMPLNLMGLQTTNVLVAGREVPGFRSLPRGKSTMWRKEALAAAHVMGREAKASFLLVLEEGQRLSPDLLPFMAQLAPLLQRDATLWCVSAWNDQGLAPYVADPTVVLRSDVFSGVAWMVTLDLLESEIMTRWKEEKWAERLRSFFRGRQCLIPEVSRAVPGTGDDAQFLARMPLVSRSPVDLGDVSRLLETSYLRLLIFDWPNEGLWQAKPLTSLRPLADGRSNSDGPHSLVFRCNDVEKDVTWKAVANFFSLWSEVPIRGMFMGVLRLRWRDSILYLIASSSPLLQAQVPGFVANLTMLSSKLKWKSAVDPMLFYGLSAPFLRPPGGEVLASQLGANCLETCASLGRVCLDEDLFSMNHCAALGATMNCQACEPGAGAALPAHMNSGDHMGVCLSTTDTPKCSAHHEEAQRLCACRPDSGLSADVAVLQQVPQGVPQVPEGWIQNVSLRNDGDATEVQEAASPIKTELPILVVASAGRLETLQRALHSLASLPGYRRDMVLVSQDGSDARAQTVVEEHFKVSWVLHEQEHLGNFDARVSKHYREAISYALLKRFPTARSLIVVEEDMEAANDMLWYFAQLEPLLHEDPSLWCIGAWNENGAAAFASDLGALLRTDVFAGSLAWMLPAELYRKELLNFWPSSSWAAHFKNPVMSGGRQCIVPEVSRARHVGRDTRKDVLKAPELAALQDARLLVSGPLVEVAGPEQQVYEEEMRAALARASVIEDLSRLPARQIGPVRRWQNVPGYRLHVQGAEWAKWPMVADFFQLSQAWPVPGLYQNVLRLRWGGQAVLYLVLGTSKLVEAPAAAIAVEDFRLKLRPLMVAKESIVAAGRKDVGRSCTSLCEDQGKVCYAADLLYINSCRELREYFTCTRCEASSGPDQPAWWVPQRKNRASGACLYNSDVVLHTPSCDADHLETQRLCSCRELLSAAEVAVEEALEPLEPKQMPKAKMAPKHTKQTTQTKQTKQTKQQAEKLLARAEAAGWKPGLRAEAFRGVTAAFEKEPARTARIATTKPSVTPAPPVLLLATGDRPAALNATLRSLLARGFQSQLLISLGCCGEEVEQSKRLLEVYYTQLAFHAEEASGGLRGHSRLLAHSARDTEHLRQGLSWALRSVNGSLLVVHEGTLLSPDAVPFFQQLEPLLSEDPTIWCIGAGNMAGLAPYAADLSVVFRTDWHPASLAWMMRSDVLEELLKTWPGGEWERFLRMDQVRMGRHCLVPEVSRCTPIGAAYPLDDPALRRGERAAFEDFQQTIFWNEEMLHVNLGEVSRLNEASYDKLLLHDWPNEEGLAKSLPILPRELLETREGNFHLVLDDRHGGWPKAASFFRLPSSKEVRLPSSYKGYLRLRWRGGILHLIMWNSPLLAASGLKQKPKRGQDFPQPPVLRGPTVAIKVGGIGQSCHEACGAARCHDPDLLFLNACPTIRGLLGPDACGECLASDGQEYPAAVLIDASQSEQGPALGSCLYNANLARPPRCAAAHERLARLCPCRPSAPSAEVSTVDSRIIFRDLLPSSQISASVPSRRCGVLFGNLLAEDCAAEGLWCCSGGMWCGDSVLHCKSPDHPCFSGATPTNFCGAGWTLRVPSLPVEH